MTVPRNGGESSPAGLGRIAHMVTPELGESAVATESPAGAPDLPPPPSGATRFELPPPGDGAVRFELPPPPA